MNVLASRRRSLPNPQAEPSQLGSVLAGAGRSGEGLRCQEGNQGKGTEEEAGNENEEGRPSRLHREKTNS